MNTLISKNITERRNIKQIEHKDENGKVDYTIIPNFKEHDNFLTNAERKYFAFLLDVVYKLKEEYNRNFTIFAQVALNRIIDINNLRIDDLKKDICNKSIDFVLYDLNSYKIHCCIELNDSTHITDQKRVERDDMLRKAFKYTDIKFLEQPIENSYDLKETIHKILD